MCMDGECPDEHLYKQWACEVGKKDNRRQFTECADGSYGYSCTKKCGSCRYSEPCVKSTGFCRRGCHRDNMLKPFCKTGKPDFLTYIWIFKTWRIMICAAIVAPIVENVGSTTVTLLQNVEIAEEDEVPSKIKFQIREVRTWINETMKISSFFLSYWTFTLAQGWGRIVDEFYSEAERLQGIVRLRSAYRGLETEHSLRSACSRVCRYRAGAHSDFWTGV